MKLTWFGGDTIRIHIGGRILVCDGEGVDTEIRSGADRLFRLDGAGLEPADLAAWRPRRAPTALEDGAAEGATLWRGGERIVLVDAPGEPPLLLAGGGLPRLGRWAGEAVVVLFGGAEALGTVGSDLLEQAQPRLVALAGEAEPVFARLGARLDGAGLVVLEPGLAVEV